MTDDRKGYGAGARQYAAADKRDAQYMRGEVAFAVYDQRSDRDWRRATQRDRAFVGIDFAERPQ